MGTTRQTITSIEVGRYTASLPLAYKIAHYFGLPIEAVFDFSDLEQEVASWKRISDGSNGRTWPCGAASCCWPPWTWS